MTDAQWQKMMNPIAGKLLLDIEEDMSPCETQRIHVLASNMWDLIYQSILPAEDDRSTSLLDLNVALKFLIRNLSSENVSKRDKCSSFLVAALCQQPRSNQMRPRIAMLDPDLLNRLFEAQVNMIMNSAAEFAVRISFFLEENLFLNFKIFNFVFRSQLFWR